jgi:hypothetical protein
MLAERIEEIDWGQVEAVRNSGRQQLMSDGGAVELGPGIQLFDAETPCIGESTAIDELPGTGHGFGNDLWLDAIEGFAKPFRAASSGSRSANI